MREEIEDWEALEYRMREEGFDYCFEHYSRFEEIKDDEFHRLRKQYLEVKKSLQDYVDYKLERLIEESEDEI